MVMVVQQVVMSMVMIAGLGSLTVVDVLQRKAIYEEDWTRLVEGFVRLSRFPRCCWLRRHFLVIETAGRDWRRHALGPLVASGNGLYRWRVLDPEMGVEARLQRPFVQE